MSAEPADFPRPLVLALVAPDGCDRTLTAEPPECEALARRFGILAVESLAAQLRLWPESDGAVRCSGELRAVVVQDCVVSFEPVRQTVTDPVALRLLPPGREPADGPEDPLDEIAAGNDGMVDLGEALAEQLALALDPYPRAPDAVLPAAAGGAMENPFSVLAARQRG